LLRDRQEAMMSTRDERPRRDDESAGPMNQEPGTAAPQDKAPAHPSQERERANEEFGNEGPEEMPGFGQGA
jgi:hypothetical protein